MITTIVFDIGNVLAEFPWRRYLHSFHFTEETEERIAKALFMSDIWREADRGAMTDEEIFETCRKEIPDLEKELKEVWKERIHIVKEFPDSVSWIKKLKEKGYRVYLLSNYAKTTFEEAIKCFEFLNYVDGRVISYEIKAIKPEKEMYEELIQKYNVNPKEAVFLDDLVENLEAAKKFGFATILVQDREKAKEKLNLLLKEKGIVKRN
ncbi:MAG: HAD family phosphatase [Lachnospiraceae bacterium]|jgi:putative hydrolase of the HAD superfamily|nr:HAD family phosphatase [Lachnospiraceae bacterium]